MALLVRNVKHRLWFKEPAAALLAVGDVPTDVLGDLRTQGNTVSVFEVVPDRSNLERVVRAVAIGKEEIADTGYVLFDSQLLTPAGVELEVNVGRTKDDGANHWHRNLRIASGQRLVSLAHAILLHGQTNVVLRLRMKQLVRDGVAAKELPENFLTKFKLL